MAGLAVLFSRELPNGSHDSFHIFSIFDTYNFSTVTDQFIILSYILKGGVHTFVVSDSTEEPKLLDFLLTKENSVHMLWLIPQFFVITVGEILFSITALEFSYSQVCI